MICIDNVLIDEAIVKEYFACHLQQCKGMCCIEGEAGAPLEPDEIIILEEKKEEIFPYLTLEGVKTIKKQGVYVKDAEGEYVTPLVEEHGPCAFITYDASGIALCGIECAWKQGKVPLKKPVSCHLYPIRVEKTSYGEKLLYHRWYICEAACKKGKKEKITLLEFLREALIRKYGQEWYEKLIKIVEWRKIQAK